MPQPCTIQFGLWSPDLQNIAVQIPAVPGPIPMPCADCLNVYYQDGAYRCVPSPQSIGPSLAAQALNAFTWYDETSGNEIIFAATANGISGLTSDVWTAIPVLNALSVALTGLSLKINVGAAILPTGLGIALSQGSITITRGQRLNATMLAGQNGGGNNNGYRSGGFGSLSPSTDTGGNLVTAVEANETTDTLTLTINTGSLGQSYFSSLFISNTGTFTSSSATYSSSGAVSTWVWSTNADFVNNDSYSVILFQ